MEQRLVVILTVPFDIHAGAVSIGLKRLGHDSYIWYPAAYPFGYEISARIEQREKPAVSLTLEKEVLSNKGPDIVFWNRRRGPVAPLKGLHSEDAIIASEHFEKIIDSLAIEVSNLSLLSVNSYSNFLSVENSKISQLRAAIEVGLKVPDTLISNDPLKVRNFLDGNKTGVIYKCIDAAVWRGQNRVSRVGCTAIIDSNSLPSDEAITLSPGIFQARVSKRYEIRANVMGNFVVSARIDTPDPNSENIDWRATRSEDMLVTPIKLPIKIEEMLVKLTRRLNILFGSIDMIVDDSGDYVFLEVNQMGQFLWIEDKCPDISLLDTFCQFLVSADPCFSGPVSGYNLKFREIRDQAVEELNRDAVKFGFKRRIL